MKSGASDSSPYSCPDPNRISFREAATVWSDRFAIIAPDPEHSEFEEREWIIGASLEGNLMVVVFTARNKLIRIISARPVTKSERKMYVQQF